MRLVLWRNGHCHERSPQGHEPTGLDIEKWRTDFVVRMFPVAISVGFATRITAMGWLLEGKCPSYAEWQEMPRLLAALIIVMIGWDWYHRDKTRKPSETLGRFIIDVLVVMVDLMFLFASTTRGLLVWSLLLVVIFGLYVIWDVVSLIENPGPFLGNPAAQPAPHWISRMCDALRVYWLGFDKPTGENRGPTINVQWLLYFLGLFVIVLWLGQMTDMDDVAARPLCSWVVLRSPATMQAIASSVFTLAGIFFLVMDGNAPAQRFEHWSFNRIGIIFVLLVLYAFVTHLIVSQPSVMTHYAAYFVGVCRSMPKSVATR